MTEQSDKENPNSADAMSENDDATGAGSESPEEGSAAMADAEDAVEN
ncbi:hypothetical protein ACFXQA_10010 [Microbacterium sp. P07]